MHTYTYRLAATHSLTHTQTLTHTLTHTLTLSLYLFLSLHLLYFTQKLLLTWKQPTINLFLLLLAFSTLMALEYDRINSSFSCFVEMPPGEKHGHCRNEISLWGKKASHLRSCSEIWFQTNGRFLNKLVCFLQTRNCQTCYFGGKQFHIWFTVLIYQGTVPKQILKKTLLLKNKKSQIPASVSLDSFL